jgi:hypothetical protein
MNTFARREINWSAIGKTGPITPEIRAHLTNVYTTLAASILVAAIGSIVFLKTFFGNTLTFLAAIGLIFWLAMTPREVLYKTQNN